MAFKTKQTALRHQTDYYYEGKMIVLTKQQGRSKKRRNITKSGKVVHRGNWWPEEKKIEAATVYAVTRNIQRTKELTGVEASTLKKWTEEAWFNEIIAKVKKEKNEALDAKITETLDHTLDLINNRLTEGETYYHAKTKEYYQLPVRAKDAAIITSILFDKRQLIRGEATSRTENVSSEQKLLALKENFERLAQSKLINPNSEPVEANYEEIPFEPTAEQEAKADESPGEAENQSEVLVEESDDNESVLSILPASEGTVLRPEGDSDGVAVDEGNGDFEEEL